MMGLIGVIGAILIVLKLLGLITFSWWLVLLPFILWLVFVIVSFIILICVD